MNTTEDGFDPEAANQSRRQALFADLWSTFQSAYDTPIEPWIVTLRDDPDGEVRAAANVIVVTRGVILLRGPTRPDEDPLAPLRRALADFELTPPSPESVPMRWAALHAAVLYWDEIGSDLTLVDTYLEESLDFALRHEFAHGIARSKLNIGLREVRRGIPSVGINHLLDVLQLFGDSGDLVGLALHSFACLFAGAGLGQAAVRQHVVSFRLLQKQIPGVAAVYACDMACELAERGEVDAALAAISDAADIINASGTTNPAADLGLALARAKVALSTGNLVEAEDHVAGAVEPRDGTGVGLYGYGIVKAEVLLMLGRPAKALAVLASVSYCTDQVPIIRRLSARCHAAMGSWPEAARDMTEAWRVRSRFIEGLAPLLRFGRPAATDDAQKLRHDDELLSRLSHDVRGSLGALYLLLDVIEPVGEPDAFEERRPLLLSLVQQMRSTVGHLRALHSSGNSNLGLVAAVIERQISLYRPLADDKGQTITVRLGDVDNLSVHRDNTGLALANLLSNAIKYTPAGGQISLDADAHSSSRVRVTITDTGPGFSDADLETVFRQAGPLSAKPTGGEKSTGQGLMLTDRAIRENGGSVEILSPSVGSGAVVAVQIPAFESTVGLHENPPPRPADTEAGPAARPPWIETAETQSRSAQHHSELGEVRETWSALRAGFSAVPPQANGIDAHGALFELHRVASSWLQRLGLATAAEWHLHLARQHLDRAEDLKTEQTPHLAVLGATIALDLERVDEAITTLRQAEEATSGRSLLAPSIAVVRVRCAMLDGDLKRARRLFDAARAGAGPVAESELDLELDRLELELLVREGRPAEAIAQFDDAAGLGRDQRSIFALTSAHAALGNDLEVYDLLAQRRSEPALTTLVLSALDIAGDNYVGQAWRFWRGATDAHQEPIGAVFGVLNDRLSALQEALESPTELRDLGAAWTAARAVEATLSRLDTGRDFDGLHRVTAHMLDLALQANAQLAADRGVEVIVSRQSGDLPPLTWTTHLRWRDSLAAAIATAASGSVIQVAVDGTALKMSLLLKPGVEQHLRGNSR